MKPDSQRQALLRAIPAVDRLLADPLIVELAERTPRWIVVDAAREVLDNARAAITAGKVREEPGLADLAAKVCARAEVRARRSIRRVINATGVVIHTNLGRSVLPEAAVAAVVEAARSYSSLEYDLERGERTSRTAGVDDLVARIVGSEDGFAVNNNAGAVLIALNTVCFGRSTIVSRGELVEIGGSFRLPDVMDKSGSKMVEVGTTNRTRIEDYEAAITRDTAAILKVHHSNFAMTGFVEAPAIKDLADLAHAHSIALIEDLGSGALADLAAVGLPREPMPQGSIADGVDVVTFSGDKLLGGPQAGLIAGRREFVSKMKSNPLARALRLDKMTLAALEETLRLYLEGGDIVGKIPTLAMLGAPLEELERRARKVAEAIAAAAGGALAVTVEKVASQVGGGSLPLANPESFAVCVTSSRQSADRVIRALRDCEVPVIARILEDKVCMDLRTVQPNDDDLLARQVVAACAGRG
jgi:L-seryl-tRNA(Ser) seleniumtransferase